MYKNLKRIIDPDKSFVSMEQHKYKICTCDFETNSLIMDRRLKNSLNRHTVTGWGICPDCQQRIDDGYVALIVADPERSVMRDGLLKPEDAFRTGEILFLKRDVAEQILDPYPGNISFIDIEGIQKLRSIINI